MFLLLAGEAAPPATVWAWDALRLLAEDVRSEHAPPELLSAWGALHLIGMVGAVRDDDQADGRRLLAGAGRAAARLGGDRNDFRMAFGPTNVAIHRVAYSVELGHSRTAVRGAHPRGHRDQAPIPGRSGRWRRRSGRCGPGTPGGAGREGRGGTAVARRGW